MVGTNVGSVFFDIAFNKNAFTKGINESAKTAEKAFGSSADNMSKSMQRAFKSSEAMAKSYAKSFETSKLKAFDAKAAADTLKKQMDTLVASSAKMGSTSTASGEKAKTALRDMEAQLDSLIDKQITMQEAQLKVSAQKHGYGEVSQVPASIAQIDLEGNAKFQELEAEIGKVTTKYEALKRAAEAAANEQANAADKVMQSGAYKQLENQLARANQELNKQTSRMNYFKEQQAQAASEVNKYAQALGNKNQNESASAGQSQRSANALKAQVAAMNNNSKQATRQASAANQAAKANRSYASSAKKVAPALALAGGAAGAAGAKFLKLGTVIKGLIFGRLLRSFISSVKKGFEELAQVSVPFNNTMSQLKGQFTGLRNAIAVAFAPVLSALTPLITTVTNALISMFNALAMVTAKLLGQTSFTKATVAATDYAAGLNNAGSAASNAAKEAKGALASFDELNNLNDKNSGSDTGGGGGSGGGAGAGFEEAAIPDNILSSFDSIKKRLSELGQLFKEGFKIGIGTDFGDSLKRTKEHMASIKATITGIASDPQVVTAWTTMWNSFAFAAGQVVGSVASIGMTIAENLIGGFDIYLKQNKGYIKARLVEIFNANGAIALKYGELFTTFANIFEVFRSGPAKQITADIIGIFSNAVLGSLALASKIGRDVLSAISKPIIDNKDKIKLALENTLKPLSAVTSTIRKGVTDTFNKIHEVYDAKLKPMFEAIGRGLSAIAGTVLDTYNTHIAPVLNKLGNKFKTVWDGYVQPMLDSFLVLVGKVGEAIGLLFEKVIAPLIQWIVKNVVPVLVPIFNIIGTVVSTVVKTIMTLLKTLWDVLGGIIDFLIGVFTGDWERAWNGLKTIFSSIWDGIKKVITIFKDFFIGIWNGIKDFVVALGTFLKNLFTGIWTKIKEIAINHVTMMSKVLGTIWNGIKSIVSTVMNSIKTVVTTVWNAIKAFVESVINGIKTVITTVWEAIKTFISTVITAIKDFVVNQWTLIKTTITTIINAIKTTVTNIWNAIKTAVSTVVDGIKTKITGVWDAIKTGVGTTVSSLKKDVETKWDNIKTNLGTKVDAIKTKADKVWENIKTSLVKKTGNTDTDLTKKWAGIKTNLGIKVDEIKDKFDLAFGKIKTSVSDIMSGLWTNIKGTVNSILGGIESMANGVINGVNTVIKALNNLNFTIPDWVPAIGGKKFGFSIPTLGQVSIPKLAKGGVVDNPTLAMIGEAGQEAVVPLENNTEWMAKLANVMAEAIVAKLLSAQGSTTESLNSPSSLKMELEGRVLGEVLLDPIIAAAKRRGINLVLTPGTI